MGSSPFADYCFQMGVIVMEFTEHFGHSLNQGIAEFTDKFIKLSTIKIIMIPFDFVFYSFCSFCLKFKWIFIFADFFFYFHKFSWPEYCIC